VITLGGIGDMGKSFAGQSVPELASNDAGRDCMRSRKMYALN
jgi:hypothetical protein